MQATANATTRAGGVDGRGERRRRARVVGARGERLPLACIADAAGGPAAATVRHASCEKLRRREECRRTARMPDAGWMDSGLPLFASARRIDWLVAAGVGRRARGIGARCFVLSPRRAPAETTRLCLQKAVCARVLLSRAARSISRCGARGAACCWTQTCLRRSCVVCRVRPRWGWLHSRARGRSGGACSFNKRALTLLRRSLPSSFPCHRSVSPSAKSVGPFVCSVSSLTRSFVPSCL